MSPASTATAPHPKIRARRIEIRRDEGRRRRLRLAVVAAVLLVLGLSVAVVRSPLLDVDEVVVTGTARTSPEAVRAAAGIRHGAAMIDVDAGKVAERIEALPWVERASVQRHWPATVRVEVTERRPVAQARGSSGAPWALIDRTGRVLTESRAPDPGLVQVDGVVPGGPGTSVGEAPALDLAAALTARLAAGAASVQAGRGRLDLLLREGILVHFGSVEDLDDKLAALDAILTDAKRDPPIATIDVRVPSSSVLTRKPDGA